MTKTTQGDRTRRWGLLTTVVLAALLRLAMFPHPDEVRDGDESGYLMGSLALLEGLPPGFKAAPAGPNTWVGWFAAGTESAWYCLHPGMQERRVPIQVRPFVAIEHTLFNNYRDLRSLHVLWVGTQLLLAVWAAAAAFRYGAGRGALATGILVGGMFASLPLLVDFADMARPYATAWSFGMLALCSARCREKYPAAISGVFMGLAVASRVEMLTFAPLVFWELWDRRGENRLPWRIWGAALGVMVVSSLVAAPWLMTHLVGNLRTIATVRLGANPKGSTTMGGVLGQLAWEQGLIGAMVLCVVAFFVQERSERGRVWLLGMYVFVLVLSLGHGTVFLHQQGATILALILFAAKGMGPIARRWPAPSLAAAVALLVLPVVQTARMAAAYHRDYVPDFGTQWVEQHVPPGTRLYVGNAMRNPLPTVESSDFLWNQVTGEQAAEIKFRAGLTRFNLADDQIPRALGDENLVQEQGNRRGWFILGGNGGNGPRFDLRLIYGSPVFGILDQDVPAAFAATGGVLIYRGDSPPAALGIPVVRWTGANGTGCYIFCSPDVRDKLIDLN